MDLSPTTSSTPSAEELQRAATEDTRPTLPEPPPVRLVAVGDVSLEAPFGLERKLDEFYVGLLRFVKEDDDVPDGSAALIYAAERFDLRITLSLEPPDRQSCRPLGVMVWFFDEVIEHLESQAIDYSRVHGLFAGQDAILLPDPAGNWVAVGNLKEVR